MSNSELGQIFPRFEESLPCAQNAIDLAADWISALPAKAGLKAGRLPLFEDNRIEWLIQEFGPMSGLDVLELGSLEGGHTYQLDAAGANVDAIEANKASYIKCLIVKEALGMSRCRFYLGNFVKWLEDVPKIYNLIVMSGVLYHMTDPIHLLRLISQRCESVYIWTHYFSESLMPIGDPRRSLFIGVSDVELLSGESIRLHRRTYAGTQMDPLFCGGLSDNHRWMERDDILRVLEIMGFSHRVIAHDDPYHPNGPAFSVFARRAEIQEGSKLPSLHALSE